MRLPTEARDRHVGLAEIFNFRDLGGYEADGGRTTRWGRLYRADGIHRLAGDDIGPVRALGLRTVVDLRTPRELEERGRFPLDVLSANYHHAPVLESTWSRDSYAIDVDPVEFLAGRYVEMLEVGSAAVATVVRLLARDDSYPMVFHCAAGKDRTGVVAAVILSLVGVPDHVIASDYGLSAPGMERLEEWIRANLPDAVETMARQPKAFLAAPPLAMEAFLQRARARFGSFEAVVADHGVDASMIAAVRGNLLEPR